MARKRMVLREGTQEYQIIKYIMRHGSITSADAWYRLNIARLASRIHDLKDMGYVFDYEWEKSDKTGNRYKRYFLMKKNEIQDAESEKAVNK